MKELIHNMVISNSYVQIISRFFNFSDFFFVFKDYFNLLCDIFTVITLTPSHTLQYDSKDVRKDYELH